MEGIDILFVDDDNALQRLFTLSFRRSSYSIHMASNGKEALAMLKKYVPRLIISDVDMPVMDGFEFCRVAKQDPHTRDIPFIFLTAGQVGKAEEAQALGALDYILKPFSMAGLRVRVDHLLHSDGEQGHQ